MYRTAEAAHARGNSPDSTEDHEIHTKGNLSAPGVAIDVLSKAVYLPCADPDDRKCWRRSTMNEECIRRKRYNGVLDMAATVH